MRRRRLYHLVRKKLIAPSQMLAIVSKPGGDGLSEPESTVFCRSGGTKRRTWSSYDVLSQLPSRRAILAARMGLERLRGQQGKEQEA